MHVDAVDFGVVMRPFDHNLLHYFFIAAAAFFAA
jgi:hypothetical protein